MDIDEITRILSNIPPLPWHVREGCTYDHWELWSSHPTLGCHIIHDDADVEPDKAFLEYICKSREIIEYLVNELISIKYALTLKDFLQLKKDLDNPPKANEKLKQAYREYIESLKQ